jgi:hypothetical protein
MPRLACRACGRQIYSEAPIEALLTDEPRCPRCGASLNAERREAERRQETRRQDTRPESGSGEIEERRVAERRAHGRRSESQ